MGSFDLSWTVTRDSTAAGLVYHLRTERPHMGLDDTESIYALSYPADTFIAVRLPGDPALDDYIITVARAQ
jgi:hypothetical protein